VNITKLDSYWGFRHCQTTLEVVSWLPLDILRFQLVRCLDSRILGRCRAFRSGSVFDTISKPVNEMSL